MFGLMGAHRTGKTTLAEATAVAMGGAVQSLTTNLSGVFEELGLSVRDSHDFPTMMRVQNALLDRLEKSYLWASHLCNKPFLADRTPLDVLAYTLADVKRDTIRTAEDRALLESHVLRVRQLTMRYFKALVLIQPGIEIKDDPSKAPPCPHYINHLNAIMIGLIRDGYMGVGFGSGGHDSVLFGILSRETTHLDDRVTHVELTFSDILASATEARPRTDTGAGLGRVH